MSDASVSHPLLKDAFLSDSPRSSEGDSDSDATSRTFSKRRRLTGSFDHSYKSTDDVGGSASSSDTSSDVDSSDDDVNVAKHLEDGDYSPDVIRNIRYYEDSKHPKHVLNIYLPKRSAADELRRKPVPVVVHVHGGGWQRGDKDINWRGSPPVGTALSRDGICTVTISYRLTPPTWFNKLLRSVWFALFAALVLFGFTKLPFPILPNWTVGGVALVVSRPSFLRLFLTCYFFVLSYAIARFAYNSSALSRHPAQAIDVARAVRWVRDNIHAHVPDADVGRSGIYLCGHSAGAHLASLVSVDHRFLREQDVEPSFVKGVIAISGIYNIESPMLKPLYNGFFRLAYTTSAFGSNRKKWRDPSPLFHVKRDLSPFLLLNAEKDFGLDHGAKIFCEKLREHYIEVDHKFVPKTTHASICSKFHIHEAHRHVTKFVWRTHAKQCGGGGDGAHGSS